MIGSPADDENAKSAPYADLELVQRCHREISR